MLVYVPRRLPSLPLLNFPASAAEQSEDGGGGLVSPLGRKAEILHGEVAVGRRNLARERARETLLKAVTSGKSSLMNRPPGKSLRADQGAPCFKLQRRDLSWMHLEDFC